MTAPIVSMSQHYMRHWIQSGFTADSPGKRWRRSPGVSASTLTRLSQGRQPDVSSLAALTNWLGMSADHFMRVGRVEKFGGASPLAQISSILHRDPHLNPEGSAALEELIKATYSRLRTDRHEPTD